MIPRRRETEEEDLVPPVHFPRIPWPNNRSPTNWGNLRSMNCSWTDGLRLLVRGNSVEEALPGREEESELSVWSGNQPRSSTRIDGGDDDDAAHRQALKGNKGRRS